MDWIDRFLASHLERCPVDATFIGQHGFDGRLPDRSERGLAEAIRTVERLLRDAPPVERAAVGRQRAALYALDVAVACGALRIQHWELTGPHAWRGNPALYTGEAVFGPMSLLLTGSQDASARVEALVRRLEAVPTLLAQGRTNVPVAPAEWSERAVRECEGGIAFCTDGLDRWLAGAEGEQSAAATQPTEPPQSLDREHKQALRRAAETAAAAFAEHRAHLRDRSVSSTERAVGCGEGALRMHLSEAHFVREEPAELLGYARDQLREAEAALESGLSELGLESLDELKTRLAGVHPEPEDWVGRFGELWQEARKIAREHDVVTWPDDPIRYVERPGWARSAAPHLYFLFYRSPAPDDPPDVHDYLVAPQNRGAAPQETAAFLRAQNESVMKLNHVAHHGGLGHHVQNGHARRSASRIGRMAAVDCAAHTALLAGGTMAEGWACYATDLMDELGWLTPAERCAEHASRIRMCARAIVDLELHSRRWGLTDAARFYEERASMSAGAARSEAVKNSMFPGGAIMYLLGRDGIHDLRERVRARDGPGFSLRRFHDELLSYGSLPLRLVADAMMGES